MIVVDTTVLVYAVGGSHRLAEPCRHLVELIGEGTVAATTTVEAIQEFAHIRARRRGREDAADLARRYMTLLTPLLTPDEQDLEAGLALFTQHEQLGAFDAVLAAAARSSDAAALVSADRGFAVLEDPLVLDPAADGFTERLVQLGRGRGR